LLTRRVSRADDPYLSRPKFTHIDGLGLA